MRFFFLTLEGLSRVWLLFTNSLMQCSRFEVLLTADSQCFTHDDSRTFVPTVARRRRTFTSGNIEGVVHIISASSFVMFFHLATPSLVHSPSQSPPSLPSPSLPLSLRPQLSRNQSIIKRISRTSLRRIWNIHNAVSRHFVKNRGKHGWSVSSMNKTQESKQRSTKWRRRHLGYMQQQQSVTGPWKTPRKELRLDVHTLPWPQGWSFLRLIYTSCGSQCFKKQQKPFLPIQIKHLRTR